MASFVMKRVPFHWSSSPIYINVDIGFLETLQARDYRPIITVSYLLVEQYLSSINNNNNKNDIFILRRFHNKLYTYM